MYKKILAIITLSVGVSIAAAQGLRDVKINEILVKNQSSFTDDHSEHTSWIELFNSGYTSGNVGGTSLRFIQGKDTTVYRIPKTDVRTQIAPQGYLLFFASGSSNKGTFHTNFSLNVTDSAHWESLVGLNDRLELLDQGGNMVDFIEYDVNTQIPDVSYGRIFDFEGDSMKIEVLESVTPMQSNEVHERIPKSELFRIEDPAGIAMAIIAMSVVFMALFLLYIIFKFVGNVMQKQAAAKKAKAAAPAAQDTKTKITKNEEMNGEELAAISLALFRYYEELHDLESEIITINRVARAYSPWNSKIHTLTKNPRSK